MRTAQVYQWSGDELRGYQGRLYSHEHRAATEGSARTEPHRTELTAFGSRF